MMVAAFAVMLVAGNMPTGLFIVDSGAIIILMAGGSGCIASAAVYPHCRGKTWLQRCQQQEHARDERAQHHAESGRTADHSLFPHVFAANVKQTNTNVNALPQA